MKCKDLDCNLCEYQNECIYSPQNMVVEQNPSANVGYVAELEELRLYKKEHERLKDELNEILHPNGDSPLKPSFCDLVAFVRQDLEKAT